MNGGEAEDRDGSGGVGEERVFSPLAEEQECGGCAEAAEEGGDEKVLTEFEDGDGAIDEGEGESKHGGEAGPPLGLAGLEGLEFLNHRKRALHLRREAAFEGEEGGDHVHDGLHGRGGFGALEKIDF